MLAPREVWNELCEADERLRSMAEETPSAKHLRFKFSALHQRLYYEPPAGRDETIQRLRAMRDECWAELEPFRPAVEEALVVAEQHDW
ncbi:MAG: hypothetical protein ACYTAO_19820 [Planctomycetota bacterium]|jgi:hypothetical protein